MTTIPVDPKTSLPTDFRPARRRARTYSELYQRLDPLVQALATARAEDPGILTITEAVMGEPGRLPRRTVLYEMLLQETGRYKGLGDNREELANSVRSLAAEGITHNIFGEGLKLHWK